MKILVLHQYYLMPGAAGGSRFNELTRLWSEAGDRVSVIAGNLDYSTNMVPDRYRGRLITRESDGPVEVLRCRVSPSYGRGRLGRMWAYLTFALTATLALLRAERPDVIVATSPPLPVVLPAFLAARVRFRGVPWVFEVRDLWPESAVTTGVLAPRGPLTRVLYALERWACAQADAVNVLTPAFRADILRRHLAPAGRIWTIPNGADEALFSPGPRNNGARTREGWGDRFVVLYAGAHGRANAVGQLVEAAEQLRDRPDILIATLGDGPERARWEGEARRRGLSNIRFHGARAKEQMPEYVNACDVGAAVLQRNPTFMTVYPNKVFDYMACARPVLLAIDGVARELVCEQAGAGVFARPEDPLALADAIRGLADAGQLRAEMGARGRRFVLANLSRSALAARYADELRALVARGPVRRRGLGSKAALDRAAAALGLVALAPLLGLLALLVRLSLGSPVLFRQPRPGRFGRPFMLVKFRTMREGKGSDAERLTPIGRLLRSTSLDELPTLWNVLRGEMGLVGPRPLLPEYLDRYSAEQARRHDVRPGITGWAQVNGRNAIDWDRKLALDVHYVDNRSLALDLRILGMTLRQLATRRGVSHPGSVTMPEFLGTGESGSRRRGESRAAGGCQEWSVQ